MKKPNISLDKAKKEKLFYVVTSGVIYHPKLKKCLILQRSRREIVHPLLWGVVGGKMEWSEIFETKPGRINHGIPDWGGLVEQSLIREAREESGLETKDPKYMESVVFVRPDDIPVVLLIFALKYKSGRVKIPLDFEDFAWVNEKEVGKYHCIEGIAKEVENTVKIYQTS